MRKIIYTKAWYIINKKIDISFYTKELNLIDEHMIKIYPKLIKAFKKGKVGIKLSRNCNNSKRIYGTTLEKALWHANMSGLENSLVFFQSAVFFAKCHARKLYLKVK